MTRRIVLALVLLTTLAFYGTVFAEEASSGKNTSILPNLSFEELTELPSMDDLEPLLFENVTYPEGTSLFTTPECFFPFGWNKFTGTGGDVAFVIKKSESGNQHCMMVTSQNESPVFTNMAYVTFPAPETLAALKGKPLVLKARVFANISAPGAKGQEPITGMHNLVQGPDFTAADEMRLYSNFVGINILYIKNPTIVDGKAIEGHVVPAEMKQRNVLFSSTEGFVELTCDTIVPADADTAVLILESKGQATGVFSDVTVNVVENRAAKIALPSNLDMKALTCSAGKHPKDWYFQLGGQRAYARQSSEQVKTGSYSLEIGNPDPLNNSDNVVFASNFDIRSNRGLWGKEVKFSALVKTDMVPGHTKDSRYFEGSLNIVRGVDYQDFTDLTAYQNYASANVQCRTSTGKMVGITKQQRTLVFGKSDGWATVETTVTIPPRTFSIEWQLLTCGLGRAWFDDVTIKTDNGFSLTNIGFEEAFLNAPDSWELDTTLASAMLVADAEHKTDGTYSLCLISPRSIEVNGGFYLSANVPYAKKVVWEADVKTDIDKNDFQQSAYIEIETNSEKKVDNAAMEGWPLSRTLSGKSDWTRLKAVIVVDENVLGLYFKLHMKGVGKVYFDNMKITPYTLALPSNSVKNPTFALDPAKKAPAGWEAKGVGAENPAVSNAFRSAYAYGRINRDGARIYQDLFEAEIKAEEKKKRGSGAEVVRKYFGKPITFRATLRCAEPASAVAGIEFLTADGTVMSSFEDQTPVLGSKAVDLLVAPFETTEVETTIPDNCSKVRAFLKFKLSGKGVPKYQILRFSLSGGTAAASDAIVCSEGTASDYLGKYGVVLQTEVHVPSGALINASFSATDARKPTNYEFEGLKCWAINPKEELLSYTAIPIESEPVSINQSIPFPKEMRDKIANKSFKFNIEGYVTSSTQGKIGIEFLDAAGNSLGSPVFEALPVLSDSKLLSHYFYRTAKSNVKAVIPAGAASANLLVEANGKGKLVLNKAGMDYVYVASGLLDWLAYTMIFDFAKLNVLFGILILGSLMIYFIFAARRKDLFIRKISGLDSIDEAVGRATEMGKPILYTPGLDDIQTLNTIAALNILGRVAKKVAEYDTPIIVPNRDPIVMTVAQETVKSAFLDAGRPDAFREESVYYITDAQFAYVSAVAGTMMRERPAANFFMGGYYAESLILAETGAMTGAIQVAGTDSVSQLPFFIVACDYTLMGEELYAASAYLSREPMQMGSLKGSDYSKITFFGVIIIGTIAASLNLPSLRWIVDLLRVQ